LNEDRVSMHDNKIMGSASDSLVGGIGLGGGQLTSGKTWELSLYELHRSPQEVITDQTEIAVSPRSLHNELMCPICLDMLKNTMTTKECLHRFCQECIITALRTNNKECPTCRKKLISKRALRPDPNFDMLISKIYPNRDEYEAQQEKLLANLRARQSYQNIEEGLKMQAMQRLQKGRGRHDGSLGINNHANHDRRSESPSSEGYPKMRSGADPSESSNSYFDDTEEEELDSETSSMGCHGGDEVEVIFRPIKDDIEPTRFIKTTVNATVDHLVKYLFTRQQVEQNDLSSEAEADIKNGSSECNDYKICIKTGPGQFNPLPGHLTLSAISEKYFPDQPLELYYA